MLSDLPHDVYVIMWGLEKERERRVGSICALLRCSIFSLLYMCSAAAVYLCALLLYVLLCHGDLGRLIKPSR